MRFGAGRATIVAGCLLAAGCEDPPLENVAVREFTAPLTDEDLETFLRIVESFPESKLPELPRILAPAPDWNASRTLPVSELVEEERRLLEQRWSPEWLAGTVKKSRRLDRVLSNERMTLPQFLGLLLSIGGAASKGALHEKQDLDRILRTGERTLDRLSKDRRPFSSLSREEMHAVLQQAAWATRVDRAKRLKIVPEENVVLAEKYRDKLLLVLPGEFLANPFDDLVDLLGEKGLPFEELPESGFDDGIEWSLAVAVVGKDEPDDGPPTSVPASAEGTATTDKAAARVAQEEEAADAAAAVLEAVAEAEENAADDAGHGTKRTKTPDGDAPRE